MSQTIAPPPPTTVDAEEAASRFPELVAQVARPGERVVVTENGIPVAAIVSPAELAHLKRRDEDRDRLFAIIDEVQAAFADVPVEEIEGEIAKALAEVRAEMRAERERAAIAS